MKQFYLYSRTTNSFYPAEAPADSVLITDDTHTALFDGQSNGMAINSDKNGHPISTRQGEQFEEWNADLEKWVVDIEALATYEKVEAEAKKQSKIIELESLIQKLEQDLLIANIRGKDTAKILAELDEVESMLDEIKKAVSMNEEGAQE